MTEQEKAEAIMKKYDRNFGILQEKATARELKTVYKFIADESNRRQRELVGLDDPKETES